MENKRITLRKIAGLSAIFVALPNAWTKPVIDTVLLPTHAQTSSAPPSVSPQSPIIRGISCTIDTNTPGVGSVMTLNATILDADTAIEDITWAVKKNGAAVQTGTGQFIPFEYTVLAEDIGMLTLTLEATDDTNNSVSAVICNEQVPGTSLVHISAVTPNPVGGDCGIDARETVSITNSGTGDADLTGFTLDRVLLAGPETLIALSGSLSSGQTITYDVCQGTSAGTSSVLSNSFGGVVRITDGIATIDIVRYPPVRNGPAEGTLFSYAATPSTTNPRSN